MWTEGRKVIIRSVIHKIFDDFTFDFNGTLLLVYSLSSSHYQSETIGESPSAMPFYTIFLLVSRVTEKSKGGASENKRRWSKVIFFIILF